MIRGLNFQSQRLNFRELRRSGSLIIASDSDLVNYDLIMKSPLKPPKDKVGRAAGWMNMWRCRECDVLERVWKC